MYLYYLQCSAFRPAEDWKPGFGSPRIAMLLTPTERGHGNLVLGGVCLQCSESKPSELGHCNLVLAGNVGFHGGLWVDKNNPNRFFFG